MTARATIAEAVAVLNISPEALGVAMDLMRPDAAGTVEVAHILSAAVLACLGRFDAEDAVAIAYYAGQTARAAGGRTLAVLLTGDGEKPAAIWRDDIDANRLQNVTLLIPADAMMRAIVDRIAAHRAQSSRPN